MLQKKNEEAFRTILLADSKNPEKSTILATFFEDFDAEKAFKALHPKHSVEKSILDGFRRANGPEKVKKVLEDNTLSFDYMSAIMAIPKKMRTLYPHAYQSFLWNRVLSERITDFGKKVVPGDYVLVNEEPIFVEDEKDAEKYSLFEMAIPIFGSETNLKPESIVSKIYSKILKEEGVDADSFRDHHGCFMLNGGWRVGLIYPKNFRHKVVYFDSWSEDLLSLDCKEEDCYAIDGTKGKFSAILAQFELPKSCYATMLIRELLHNSTDPLLQNALNEKAKALSTEEKKEAEECADEQEAEENEEELKE